MKKILCFGDSNTYGYNPANGGRYDKNTRWTGVLQTLCGENYKIIEAGGNNRNALIDSPKCLPQFLKANPDIVILAIGINDLQKFYNPSHEKIKTGISQLIDMAGVGKTLLAAPPRLSKEVLQGNFSSQFDENSIQKSLEIGKIYETLAAEKNCGFINLDDYVEVSPKDGLHFEPEQHRIIAETIFKKLKKA